MSARFFSYLLAALLLSAILQAIIGVPAYASGSARECNDVRMLSLSSDQPRQILYKGSKIVISGDGTAQISFNGSTEIRKASRITESIDKEDIAEILEILGTEVKAEEITDLKTWNLISQRADVSSGDNSMSFIEVHTMGGAVHKVLHADGTFGTCK